MREDRLLIPKMLKDLKLTKRTNASVYWPDKFAVHKIFDNGIFYLFDNVFDSNLKVKVDRTETTKGAKQMGVGHTGQKIQVEMPMGNKMYNMNKNGCDNSDQIKSNMGINDNVCMIWWHSILTGCLSVATSNS